MIISFWESKIERYKKRYQINRDIELAQIRHMLKEQKFKELEL